MASATRRSQLPRWHTPKTTERNWKIATRLTILPLDAPLAGATGRGEGDPAAGLGGVRDGRAGLGVGEVERGPVALGALGERGRGRVGHVGQVQQALGLGPDEGQRLVDGAVRERVQLDEARLGVGGRGEAQGRGPLVDADERAVDAQVLAIEGLVVAFGRVVSGGRPGVSRMRMNVGTAHETRRRA